MHSVHSMSDSILLPHRAAEAFGWEALVMQALHKWHSVSPLHVRIDVLAHRAGRQGCQRCWRNCWCCLRQRGSISSVSLSSWFSPSSLLGIFAGNSARTSVLSRLDAASPPWGASSSSSYLGLVAQNSASGDIGAGEPIGLGRDLAAMHAGGRRRGTSQIPKRT